MQAKYIDINEFRRLGYLQEANRLFFHPLGLALEVQVNDITGKEFLSGVWDYREDKEGIYFGHLTDQNKTNYVQEQFKSRQVDRFNILGFTIQDQSPGDVMNKKIVIKDELDVKPVVKYGEPGVLPDFVEIPAGTKSLEELEEEAKNE
jgi:hypothetical protein